MMAEPPRVLVVHNAYQHRGGEDSVVEAEVALLRARGLSVEFYLRSNFDANRMSGLALAKDTVWAKRTTTELKQLIDDFRPSVIHAHNLFPLISPSLYWVASKANIPVVQTLHNFRLMCLNALFMRDGKTCEDCLGKSPLLGVARACYRDSHSASAVVGAMLMVHRAAGTFQSRVARYIALNEFSRAKFIDAGLPPERLVIKPNFVDMPPPESMERDGLLYVGRLSSEKGIEVLSDALRRTPSLSIQILGDGPLRSTLANIPGAIRLGTLDADAVRHKLIRSTAMVLPSICYENFPRTIVEAFACGTPVIASRIGGLPSIVEDGETGLLVKPGDPDDLRQKMTWALENPQQMARMGQRARQKYESEFTGDVNFAKLMEIYSDVTRQHRPAMSALGDFRDIRHPG